jgi:GNAT superfamily N-acetyltransferase
VAAACENPGMLTRAPHLGDVAALDLLHVEAWQAAYAGKMPQQVLDRAVPGSRVAMWERLITAGAGPREHIVVAEVDGEVAGFAHTGPCRDGDDGVPGGLGELFAINVKPSWWGKGVGKLLLAAAHGDLRAEGFGAAILWVLPGNDRARRFYEAHGWSADGETREVTMAGAAIPEVRYRIALAATDPRAATA